MGEPRTKGSNARARARALKEEQARAQGFVQGKIKLTPELQNQICLMVASGAPLPLACPAAGISWKTAQKWLAPGMVEREPYRSFAEATEKARAAHAVGSALRITQAARKGVWQADLAILERRHPEFFGKRFQHEAVDPGKNLPAHAEGVDVDALTDDELERIARGGTL